MTRASGGMASIYVLCALEHLAGGMATVALFTCMMDWCSVDQAASDYTAQASAVVITTGTATLLAGASADLLGYTAHFALAAVLCVGAVAAVAWRFPSSTAASAGERSRAASRASLRWASRAPAAPAAPLRSA